MLRTVDLGYGTGLNGRAFLDISQELVGIDLSSRSNKETGKKGIYSEWKIEDITEARYQASFQKMLNLFVCSDVVIYLKGCADFFLRIMPFIILVFLITPRK